MLPSQCRQRHVTKRGPFGGLGGPTSIRCRLQIQDVDSQHTFNSERRHHLFLAFKEALTNMACHSGASEAHYPEINGLVLAICL